MNKKRILSSVLAAALTLGTTTAFAQENGALLVAENTAVTYASGDTYSDGIFKYTELSDGTYQIEDLEDETLTEVNIPAMVNGKEVTSILLGAFWFNNLTSINVDPNNSNFSSVDGVLFNKSKTNLLRYPAGKKNTSYTIPNSVTDISNRAFYKCASLTSAIIPDSVTYISDFAFRDCINLTSVTIPNSITRINGGTFEGCTSLTSVIIPNSVTVIMGGAFGDCTGLLSVTIPNSVVVIGSAFFNCASLKDVYYSGTEEEWNKIDIYTDNDPLLNATIHYNSTAPVSGSVQIEIPKPASGNIPDTSNVKVDISGDKNEQINICADGKLDLTKIGDGNYKFTFSANNCAPRTCTVKISNGMATGLDSVIELNLYGDMDGDGVIELTDVMDAYLTLRKPQSKSEYQRAVADANQKGGLNISDVMDIFLHLRGKSSLWK